MTSDDQDDPENGHSSHAADADDDGLPVGGRERPARRYLAIGELLDTLRPEFPDLTLSKIRFLEQQGLLEPERTPSGYRKFFSGQVERLWWILDQQREGYVPLKEIRQRLAAAEASGILSPLSTPPSVPSDATASVHRLEPRTSAVVAPIPLNRAAPNLANSDDHDHDHDHDHDEAPDLSLRNAPKEALGESRHPSSVARRVQHAFAAMTGDETTGATGNAGRSTTGRSGAGRSTTNRSIGSDVDALPSSTQVGSSASTPDASSTTRSSLSASDPTSSPTSGPSRRAASPASTRSATSTGRSGTPVPTDTSRVASGADKGRAGRAVGADRMESSESGERVSTRNSQSRPQAPTQPAEAFGSSNPLIGQYTGASFTFDELVRASALEPDELRQLESFGLLAGHQVLGATYYDEDALLAARAAHGFKQFGIEPRHMRIYRTMADRESGFLEQIVSPLVHRRQQAARTVAADQLEELIALGTQLRLVALRRLLRSSLDGR